MRVCDSFCVCLCVFLGGKAALTSQDETKRETNTIKCVFPGWIYDMLLKACNPARVVGGATGKIIAFLRLNSGGGCVLGK